MNNTQTPIVFRHSKRPQPTEPKKNEPAKHNQDKDGFVVRIIDEDNESLIKEMHDANAALIAALGASKVIRIASQEYCVLEHRFDLDEEAFYVMVTKDVQ